MTTKNKGPNYPNLMPWLLEPHYCKHIGAMTEEDPYSKAAIAEQLAYRDKIIEDLGKIINRSLACGQMEKLEDARPVLAAFCARVVPSSWGCGK